MSNLKTYLAEKYMSGPKADAILAKTAPQKKKKRKAKEFTESSVGGMLIRDDDGGWGDATKEDEDDLAEAVVEKDRGFKKRKVAGSATESNWITLQDGVGGMKVKEESPPPAADEQPVVVDMAPAVVGGLMNPKVLKKVLPQNNIVDAMNRMTEEEIARAQETVYRDASGKKIDTKAAKAEAARLKREREEREAKKMEWGKGLVQRDEVEKRRQELEKQKTTTFARYADDKDLNDQLKAKELWNDPAAQFLTVRPLSLSLQSLLISTVLSEK
jgi:pre-mRNA-splicing factor CWC26